MLDDQLTSLQWRWQRACATVDLTPTQALGRLAKEDDLTRRAARFLRAAARNVYPEGCDDIGQAYKLATDLLPMRVLVEAMLLGQADDNLIHLETGLPLTCLAAYSGLFFDVRARPRPWIAAQVFGADGAYHNDPGDLGGLLKRLGYLYGYDAALAFGFGRELSAPAQQRLVDSFNTLVFQKAMAHALGPNVAPGAMVRLASTRSTSDPTTSSTDEQTGAALMAFLTSRLPVIATEQESVGLPAREPRATEYFQ